ncbi:MAG: hypothetical protein M5R42_16845 [Rhodocyclaceae bacterium]|nr:hypothetical protein [Rhodocyclaceae bacterium]
MKLRAVRRASASPGAWRGGPRPRPPASRRQLRRSTPLHRQGRRRRARARGRMLPREIKAIRPFVPLYRPR